MATTVEAEIAVKRECGLGEGSVWDYRVNKLLWLDILKAELFRFDPATGENEVHPLKDLGASAVSSVVPLGAASDPTGDLVGVTITEGFATYSFSKKALTRLSGSPPVAAGERFNDGKVDPAGRYWAGTLARDDKGEIVSGAASLYMRDTNGTVTKVAGGLTISNGLCWSADATKMYYADTPTGQVDVFDYDVTTGAVSNRRPAVPGFTFGEPGVAGSGTGFPDGNCIDGADRLWIARFNGGCAGLYDPAKGGAKICEAKVPAGAGLQVTSVALSGATGDLYLTTAREGFGADEAAKYPLAGSLFVVKRAALEAAAAAAPSLAREPPSPGLKYVAGGAQRLQGKVIVVTGSSKGIGKGVAIRLAREGAKVVINYRSDPEGAKKAAAECEAFSGAGNAIAIHADLGKKADCEMLIEKSAEHFGTLDVLVNNAGMEVMADFWEVTERDYDRVLDVNLKGPFFTTQAFVKKLQAYGKTGSIVNMSSVHEDLPFPGFSPYCCSKGGMKMMTRNLSIELAPLGITINNIAPGAIETPINAAMLKQPEKLAELLGNIPLKRLGQPGDIGSCVVYLASDEASYVTGTTIVVDGGLTWNYVEKH